MKERKKTRKKGKYTGKFISNFWKIIFCENYVKFAFYMVILGGDNVYMWRICLPYYNLGGEDMRRYTEHRHG